ncbi:probable polygalacturonase At3g15720 [Chenopodium quinoa]|uniref:probable polygalacturonase At3g15720 n=1 Tax=Chenopodium quinoa TaxID=63459 RepID=UPI000B794891|nr:probable polygalacturonase At3g15720 [Chenopodium quinoa]
MTLWNNEVHAQSEQSFNLLDFGAIGDGNIDDSQILGKIIGPKSLSDYPTPTPDSWLEISKVDGLYVSGDGIIDGRRQVWWKTCRGNDCPRRPATAAFISCNNLTLRGLTFVNSSRNHISIRSCNNVIISRLIIQAPGDSVNTDDIDITFFKFCCDQPMLHCNSMLSDDCVAITNESHDINITKVHCGPGHGISIGSLGKGGGNDTIQNVHVWNCTFKDTTNGARIKTWQEGLGFARNIIYEDLLFENASNPIIIDQFYCPGQ